MIWIFENLWKKRFEHMRSHSLFPFCWGGRCAHVHPDLPPRNPDTHSFSCRECWRLMTPTCLFPGNLPYLKTATFSPGLFSGDESVGGGGSFTKAWSPCLNWGQLGRSILVPELPWGQLRPCPWHHYGSTTCPACSHLLHAHGGFDPKGTS